MKKEAPTNHADINTSPKANAVRQRLAIVTAKEVIDRILNSCSNWYRLRRRVARLIRFIHFLHDRKTVRTGHLVLEDYDAAATAIVRIIQRSSYSQEIKDLKTRGEVKSSTSIVSLSPVVVDHGILRVKGRIAHAPVTDAARNQIILPRDHPVTTDDGSHTHESIGHLLREHRISKVREKLWIPQIRVLTHSFLGRCIPF